MDNKGAKAERGYPGPHAGFETHGTSLIAEHLNSSRLDVQ